MNVTGNDEMACKVNFSFWIYHLNQKKIIHFENAQKFKSARSDWIIVLFRSCKLSKLYNHSIHSILNFFLFQSLPPVNTNDWTQFKCIHAFFHPRKFLGGEINFIKFSDVMLDINHYSIISISYPNLISFLNFVQK